MNRNVATCPKCGALISPNLARCRQCKHYLHGTQAEGFLLEQLLPAKLAGSPGTGIFFLLIVGYYALMVMFAGVGSALGFSPFSTQQLGSTWSLAIWQGQYWRFVTSMLAHGGIVHLAFNLYALTIVGPLIEQLFDRKKMMLLFLVCGVASMACSHVYSVELTGSMFHGSVGASGAISGLIGACWVGARRRGPEAKPVANVMLQWTAYMAILGLAMGGIDNAAHVSGWVIGAGMAAVLPLGLTRTVAAQRVLSVVVLALLAGCLVSIGLMLAELKGFPASLPRDAYPKRVFLFELSEGAEWKHSSQYEAARDCQDALSALANGNALTDEHIYRCELAARTTPDVGIFQALLAMHEHRGDAQRVRELRPVVQRLMASRAQR